MQGTLTMLITWSAHEETESKWSTPEGWLGLSALLTVLILVHAYTKTRTHNSTAQLAAAYKAQELNFVGLHVVMHIIFINFTFQNKLFSVYVKYSPKST